MRPRGVDAWRFCLQFHSRSVWPDPPVSAGAAITLSSKTKARDARLQGFGQAWRSAGHRSEARRPQIYLAAALAARENLGQASSFCVWTAGDPMLLVPAIRQAANDLGRNGPTAAFEDLGDRIHEAMAATRFELTLMTVFSTIALVIALVGLYGVISYMVTER